MSDLNSRRNAFLSGLADGGPFIIMVGPFGAVFGVIATATGLDVVQAMAFSIVVIAGASQLAALQLMSENAPTLIVIATGIAVNLRMAMYSASLAPHLGAAPLWQRALVAYSMVDQAYATSIAEYEQRPQRALPAKIAYYFGAVTLVIPAWFLGTFLGAYAGAAIPADVPIGFAVPIAFVAIITPMLRTLAHVAAAVVSVVGALLLIDLPYNLGLFVAALAAMITGALVESRSMRR